jgi:nitrite reductase (NADH) small subunit
MSGLAEAPAAAGRWSLAGRASDVPLLEGRTASVAGRRVAVFRLVDGWVALDAHCPHAGGPLADGIVADACVTCPLHGRRFDLSTGFALNGPEAVAVHEVREADGELWVRLA